MLGYQPCQKIFIKFHTIDGDPLDDAGVDVVVCDDLEIVGHGYASKSHIFTASAGMPTNGLN
jgi:hypothetical protein